MLSLFVLSLNPYLLVVQNKDLKRAQESIDQYVAYLIPSKSNALKVHAEQQLPTNALLAKTRILLDGCQVLVININDEMIYILCITESKT